MALDTSKFIVQPSSFEGLNQMADTIERRRLRDEQLNQKKETQKRLSTQFLTNYLDPKDYLTGTAYDPLLNEQLNDLLQQGATLAAEGASAPDLMMALGPGVQRLSEYSGKAKLLHKNLEEGLKNIEGIKGYNLPALKKRAKKMAFFDETGNLRDIREVNPNTNYISEVAKLYPEEITTSEGFDEYIKGLPIKTKIFDKTLVTGPGRSKQFTFEARKPFYSDIALTDKGEIATDEQGNPIGLEVRGSNLVGDDGKPMVNPETNQPYKVVSEDVFNNVIEKSPAIVDYIRGQVNKSFRETGAKQIPEEGTPQWNMMARAIMYDELKQRDKSYFRAVEKEKENAAAARIQIAQDPALLQATRDYYNATRRQRTEGEGSDRVTRTTTYADVISNAMNNNPDYQGEVKEHNGKSVVDITNLIPDLKYGNKPEEIYRNVFIDPTDKSIIFINRAGKEEVVPETKVFQKMNQLSGYNNLNPDYIKNVAKKSNYEGGKFQKAAQNPYAQKITEQQQKVAQERQAKIQAFDKSGDIEEIMDFEGKKAKDGEIKQIGERSWYQSGKYYINFKDGETKVFKSKDELAKYLNDSFAGNSPAAKPSAVNPEDYRKKYNY